MKTCGERRARSAQLLLCLLVFFVLAAVPAGADPAPYVFVIFDNSTTMAWAPVCTQVDAVLDPDPFDGACTTVCPLGDPKCAALCPDHGCSRYDEADLPDPSTILPIVIDNLDGSPAFTSLVPPSANSHPNNYDPAEDTFDDNLPTLPGGATPDSANSAYRASSGAAQRFTFTPTLTHAGLWHVFAYWNKNPLGNATNARFEINYHDGSVARTRSLDVDQKNDGNAFIFLATIDFRASGGGIPASVVIRNTNEANQLRANGTVIADAVAFVPVPVAPAEPTCLEEAYLCRQPLCPQGDCNNGMGGDDPTSKFFQAKQALHEELAAAAPLQAGFGSFDQNDGRVMFKHWVYRVSAGTSPIFNFADGAGTSVPFPAPGRIDVFGTGAPYDANGRNLAAEANGFHCNSSASPPMSSSFDENHAIGCLSGLPADVRDLWEMARLQRIPKMGKTGLSETSLFVRSWNGSAFQVYRIDWEAPAAPDKLGDAIFDVQIDINKCNNLTVDPTCNNPSYSPVQVSNAPLRYQLVGDTIPINLQLGRSGPGTGFFYNQLAFKTDNKCTSLEPNADWLLASPAADDMFGSYTFKHPATVDSRGDFDPAGAPIAHATYFDQGDFLPLDWLNGHLVEVESQLAPNDVAGYSTSASTPPDYRIATYFHDENLALDSPTNLNRFLRLRDDVYQTSPGVWAPVATPPLAYDPSQRPLVAFGSTPIYQSVRHFKDWYEQWRLYAAVADPDWANRRKYLLLLTDGEETCNTMPVGTPPLICQSGNDVEYLADTLPADSQLETFAVGYGGLSVSADLACIGSNGKTGAGHTAGVARLTHDVEALKAELAAIFAQMTAP